MPYILVRGNLASYSHRYPWRVLVSGLKATDIEQLTRFASGGYCDDSTIVYLQHPCVILTALEVLGYKVVASSSTSVKQDYNEYMWTMRKDFAEPEPDTIVKSGMINLTEADLEDISEWNRQKEELKEFRNHSEIVVPAQNVECLEEEDDPTWSSEQDHSKTNNRPSEVEDKKTPIIIKDNNEYESIPDHDYELTEEEEGQQVVCYDEDDFEKAPINDPMSTKSPVGGGGSSPLKNKILHEQLLERRALRKIAEIELKRKTLELERSQYEFEQEKMCGEVRWAHEKRLMQYKEERERKLSQQ
ncbi:GSCOCG00001214001-RA-CDS [Cotesia congregata]|nr:GSCOCG00001214001-RA-CDS [Cotesia congregata]